MRTPQIKTLSHERIRGSAALPAALPLSPLDHFEAFFFTEIVYFFAEKLDGRALAASLTQTLALFPLLCGQLTRERNGSLSISHTHSGVSFTVRECDRPLPDPPQLHMSYYDALPFIERRNPFNLTKKNCPLATFTLTHMAGGGSALGVSIAHVLTDGQGLFTFLNSWSRIHNGQPAAEPFFDRSLLAATSTSNRQPVRSMPKHRSGFKYTSPAELIMFLANILCRQHDMATGTLHITETQLHAIRHEASSQGRVSLNDALCAHIWKRYTGLAGSRRKKLYHLLQPTNIRRLIEHPQAHSYFGNAVAHIIAKKTGCEIREQSTAELARDWRSTVQTIDLDAFDQQMAWLKYHEHNKKLYRVLADIDLFSGDAFITNLLKFPVSDITFGSAGPYRTEIPLIPVPGIFFILPAAEGAGSTLCAHLPKALFAQLNLMAS